VLNLQILDKEMKDFLQSDSGATAIEYSLIAAFMSLMLIVAFPFVSNALSAKYSVVTSAINK
jgi:Flp pilus assembly pilin Flp